jgi:hypothetical protein
VVLISRGLRIGARYYGGISMVTEPGEFYYERKRRRNVVSDDSIA